MRTLATIVALITAAIALGGEFTLQVEAPHHVGQRVLLYRQADLFTPRLLRVDEGLIDADGKARLGGTASGTEKLLLRIGDVSGELFVRAGSELRIRFPKPDPRTVVTIGGTARVDLEFIGIDAMDINALMADLNERLDAFIAEDLATDEVAGMQAVDVVRKGAGQPADTVQRPPTLFLTPTWSAVRVDSFELKLRRYYAGVDDPWFMANLEYGVAGLRQGPRAVDRELYERYLANKPVLYDVPEYVRFVRSFFADELKGRVYRDHQEGLKHALARTDLDSLKALFARRDFLRDDDRLCELVALDQLYLGYHGKLALRDRLDAMMALIASASVYPEHRSLAANMHWDLTAMGVGSLLPALSLVDRKGAPVAMDSLLKGATCVVVTASWCTYCDLEMAGLEQLHREYKGVIPIIAISLDRSQQELDRHLKAHPQRDFIWLRATDELLLREQLRLRSLPLVLLLNDDRLARSPAPLPSTGLGELFHRARVDQEKQQRLRVWDE